MSELDREVEATWSAEAKRRLEEIRTGAVRPVPSEEAERLLLAPRDDSKDR
jgi:Putative addiction module component